MGARGRREVINQFAICSDCMKPNNLSSFRNGSRLGLGDNTSVNSPTVVEALKTIGVR